MNKIMILVEKDSIVFSKYNRQINKDDLNNTNVINVKNLKFDEEYILANLDLTSTFVSLVVKKFNINKAIIKNVEIGEASLRLINSIEEIKNIIFSDDNELTYTISNLLLENKWVEKIECYSIPYIFFYKFNENKLKTRSKVLSESNFCKINSINTYSDFYNKDRITISELLSERDISDIIFFLNNNKNLKKIYLKRYSRQNLITIINSIRKNELKHVTIYIYESLDTDNQLLKDAKSFKNLEKKYGVRLKIKYSIEYKKKNKIKEMNFILIRNIVLTCIVLSVVLMIGYTVVEKSSDKNYKDNMKVINDIVENQKPTSSDVPDELRDEEKLKELDSYFSNYTKSYDELLKINKDTVGWLKVNNTNINYPVVQGSDNEYYLNHSFDKSYNMSGWLFVDYRNNMDTLDMNTIIYGHSGFRTDIMFNELYKVLESSWNSNKDNLKISFSIKNKAISWQIFSIYTLENTNDYLKINFDTEEDYSKFINLIKGRSIKNFKVNVSYPDEILTLSTCYGNEKYRLVVHAKRI